MKTVFESDTFAHQHIHPVQFEVCKHLLNQPKNGTNLKLFFAVTEQYLGNMCPKNKTSNSV